AYEYKGYRPEWGWRLVREKVEALDRDGYLQWGKSGRPYLKRYLHKQKGTPCNSLWIDIPPISAHAKEKLGYPTQKPLALLNRIIQASSNEGDIVLDPFCGCATTCVAATQLSRKWIGIDIEKKASDILTHRLSIATGLLDDFIITDIIPSRSDLKVVQPTESVKNLLYKEQRGLCNACGSEFEIRNLEIDHIIPKSKGGGDYYENYQLLCGSCNRIKGDRPMEYLRAKIATIELVRGKVFFGE
ncbi:MAG: HNH endonuclease, partial [Candidatus Adiutrix sp.]|nr:HNH endonuclease [Candidatus Adiutrix sp.]